MSNIEQSLSIAKRAKQIDPFYVMDILARSKQLETNGQNIIHMEVGEPDFVTPKPIVEAGIAALQSGKTHYTPALGLPALREAIADWYHTCYGHNVDSARIVVTPGASGAILLALGALLEKDQKVMLAEPGYPCNKHFARFIEAKVNPVGVSAETRYQLNAELVKQNWDGETSVAMVASPSNPTGSVLTQDELSAISAAVQSVGGSLIVDEIYHGLCYDGLQAVTALAVNDHNFVINSFSKFFGMTGWRLGWLVVPEAFIEVMDRLAQNLFLAAPTMSQYAALAAFSNDTLAILEQRRLIFESRRNFLLPTLNELGFKVAVEPQGAFYIYADCSPLFNETIQNSMDLSHYLLENAGVAITPGLDFGKVNPEKFCRFAYTTDVRFMQEAVEKIATVLKR